MLVYREVLRLHFELGKSFATIGEICGISKGGVHNILQRFAASGLSWPLPEEVDEFTLKRQLYPAAAREAEVEVDLEYLRAEAARPGVTWQLLWEEYRDAHPAGITGTESDANNNSLVLRLVYGEVSFLLTGDMEEAERTKGRPWPKSTVLKVAHHGSHNGTDAAFLTQVAPTYGAISCAKQNTYGHPHAATLQALKAAGVKTLITAIYGTITFSTDGKTISWTNSTPPTSTASTTERYIGNRNSQIFHLPTCTSLPAEKNRVAFASRDAAIQAGYRPCKRCNP